jgi:hypothetical protein
MKGIANIPDRGANMWSFKLGIFTEMFDENPSSQYYKHPTIKAKRFNNYTGNSYFDFTAHNQFDSANRLTRFTGYVNDSGPDPV